MESLERVFIALGSNIAPRGKRLAEARSMLKKISLGGWKESSIYETSPVGPQNQGPFLNQVVTFWYGKGPEKLLNYLKGAELFLGRRPRGHWEQREIDMDLLYYGECIRKGKQDGPTVPHPLATTRGFVMVPLVELDPDWVDPLLGKKAKKILEELKFSGADVDFKKVEVGDE
ncbi:MAG: 2-amino-4-hydroxy-6-hydroxymethyldihydropteridine diphosphokinase [Fibrobacter sp.]|nr:2-amino-4-hydroxy-6-hydroxymethyldihydropteridine diphosphokinase [Fibrobacter sp.]